MLSAIFCHLVAFHLLFTGEALASRLTLARGKNGTVCYGRLGCFDNSGIFSQMKVSPESPSTINTTFTLYQAHGSAALTLNSTTVEALQKPIDSEIFIIVHGFGNFPLWVEPMKRALLDKNISVIVVDWTAGSHFPNYYQAASNTRVVGSVVAWMVRSLIASGVCKMEAFTLVGFSLGAHVCGFAGKQLKSLERIVALDPAGPLFASQHPDARLAKSDAKFVQVVHTNGQSFFYGGFGTLEPMGHIDFYPNGGLIQLGCALNLEEVIIDLWRLNSSLFEEFTCSHGRAADLYTESVRRSGVRQACKFSAIACASASDWQSGACFRCAESESRLPIFGFEQKVLPSLTGQFFFSTLGFKETNVYCGNQYGLSLQPDRWVKGTITVTVTFKSGQNDQFKFLSPEEELHPSSAVVKMFALSKPFSMVKQVNLFYEKYSSWLWTNGPSNWTIRSVTVTGLTCQQQVIEVESPVVHKRTTEFIVS